MMDRQAECFTTKVIEKDGTFNAQGLDNFIKQAGLAECGLQYVIVAVIGPQGSGKSTLLNHLFGTNFREMDASKGRTQTTEGIWIAKCNGIQPCTIVLDLEGTDGRERGEDDTAFEKQSAFFAIAVSDIAIINMWCTDIGREHAANKPLLRTIFQVMLQLSQQRKTTLMFVIRDKSIQTSSEILERDLRKDIEKLWDSVSKPEAHKDTQLSEVFNVKVVALPSYELQKEEFTEQVATLRQKFLHSTAPGGLTCDRRGVVPATGLSINAQEIWQLVKENRLLNLPSVKVMVATVQCQKIANELYSSFAANQDWLELREAVESGSVQHFGKKLNLLLDSYLSSYDKEVTYFDQTIGSAKREQLKEKLIKLVQPACKLMFDHIQSEASDEFKSALDNALIEGQGFAAAALACTENLKRIFDQKCEDATSKHAGWDFTETRNKFSMDLASHVTEVRAAKLKDLSKLYKSKIREALLSDVRDLLNHASDETWHAINDLFSTVTASVVEFSFFSELSKFGMDRQENELIISKLISHSKKLVGKEAEVVARNVKYLMKKRFERIFNYENDSNLRDWTENHDIPAIAATALSSTLVLLSVLAANRLEGGVDSILDILKEGTTKSPDLLNSVTWEEIPAAMILINPPTCKQLWDQFKDEADHTITEAIVVQKANVATKKPQTIGVAAWAVPYKKTILAITIAVMISIVLATTGDNPVAQTIVAGAVAGLVSVGTAVVVVCIVAGSLKNMVMKSVKDMAQRVLRN